MFRRQRNHVCVILIFAVCVSGAAVVRAGQPEGTAFLYQGQLKQGGAPVSEVCAFEFRLFDALTEGTQIGPTLTFDGVDPNPPPIEVVNGLFQVALDFGADSFPGDARFLEIGVRCPAQGGAAATGAFIPLAPRQELTPAPYAIRALIDETFNLPLDVTLAFDQALFKLTNDQSGSASAVALSGTVTDLGTAVEGQALGPGGQAGSFQNFDPTNAAAALGVSTNGSGPAIFAVNGGTGSAAEFAMNPANAATALTAVTNGTGGAAEFTVVNPTSTATTLTAVTNGLGAAGFFGIQTLLQDNEATVLEAVTNGLGEAGVFKIQNVNNPSAVVFVSSNAVPGGLARFETDSTTTSVVDAVTIDAATTENALLVQQKEATGGVASFEHLPGSLAPAVIVRNADVGAAGQFINGSAALAPIANATLSSHSLNQGAAGEFVVANQANTSAALRGIHLSLESGPAAHLMTGGTDPSPPPLKATLRAVQLRGGSGGGSSAEFITSGVDNDDPTVFAGTLGRGRAGEFVILNNETDETGRNAAAALKATTLGFGRAGLFEIVSGPPVDNDQPAIEARTVALGSAARFEIDRPIDGTGTDPVNNSPALHVTTNASGQVARLESTSTEPVNPALEATVAGRGIVGRFAANNANSAAATIVAETQGTGSVAEFTQFNDGQVSPALIVSTRGDGTSGAAVFQNTTQSNSGDVVSVLANNLHHGLFVRQSGPGESAHFEIADPGNGNNAVLIKNNGTGTALSVENGNPNFAALALGVRGKSAFNGPVDIVSSTGGGLPVNITGDVSVNGTVTVTGQICGPVCGPIKKFRIDHPLDPQNQYLQHASVESSEMKNLYDGTVVLDENGTATVTFPDWFEALNEDFRYQLTAIGAPAPNLYIAEEIRDGVFRIAGGRPGMKVSWQVTGVRKDAYARAHPLEVEMVKPDSARAGEAATDRAAGTQRAGLLWGWIGRTAGAVARAVVRNAGGRSGGRNDIGMSLDTYGAVATESMVIAD